MVFVKLHWRAFLVSCFLLPLLTVQGKSYTENEEFFFSLFLFSPKHFDHKMHAGRELSQLTIQGRVNDTKICIKAHDQGNDVEFPNMNSMDTMDYNPPRKKSPIHN